MGSVEYLKAQDGSVGVIRYKLYGISYFNREEENRLVVGYANRSVYVDLANRAGSTNLNSSEIDSNNLQPMNPEDARTWPKFVQFAELNSIFGFQLGLDKRFVGARLGFENSHLIWFPEDSNNLLIWTFGNKKEFISIREIK